MIVFEAARVVLRRASSHVRALAIYLGPLGRRSAAFALDATLATVACAIGLSLEGRHGWFSGYDGAHIGYTVLVLPYIACEVAFMTSPGKRIFGLRIGTTSGQKPRRIQMLARALAFWLLFLEPGAFVYSDLLRPLSVRTIFLLSAAGVYTLVLLPTITVICTRGVVGIHDFVTGTRLVRVGQDAPQGTDRVGRRMLATSLSTYATLALLFVIAEWKWNLGGSIGQAIETHGEYLSGVLGSSEAAGGIIAIMSNPDYTPTYVNTETGIAMPGATEYYSYPVSPEVIADNVAARRAAYNVLIHMVPLEPHGLSWYQVELVSFSRFAFLLRSQSLRFVIDRHDFRISYAPTDVHADSTGQPYCSRARSCQPGEKPESVTIYFSRVFERRVYRHTSVVTGGWRFPSLDFHLPVRITEQGGIGILPREGGSGSQ